MNMKDYSKERNKVITYFEIGKLLNEAGGKYGDKIIEEYANKLMVKVGKKIIPELYLEWNSFIMYLVMKKSHHWCDNWVGVIV